MTEPTIPASRDRKVLREIAAVAWEHPADRAALQSLRSVPGFDEVIKRTFGFFGERGIRLLFQANAVRVGPTQFPRLNGLYTEVLTTLDWPTRPDLYVSQTPFVNAGAFGMDRPFIVVNSGTLHLFNDDELRVLLGHEVGHVMSGHVLYHTVLVILLTFGFANLPFLAGLALLPVKLALLEWYRKSELSSDRAGLLASQDERVSMRMLMKMAGGGHTAEMDLDAFLEQAREYESPTGAMDRIYKILNTLPQSHPFATLRAGELRRWIEAGAYARILDGQYPKRGTEADERPLGPDIEEAVRHYATEAKEAVGDVVSTAKKAAQAFTRAFRNRSDT